MTLADEHVPVAAWNEPDSLIPRGTVVAIPGRGELPAVYERFGGGWPVTPTGSGW